MKDQESIEIAKKTEKRFIKVMESKNPVLFIDTSKNGLSTFQYPVTPLIKDYVNKKYEFRHEVNRIKIYSLKSS